MQGTIFESHFTWQIRTFWWYLFWNILAFCAVYFPVLYRRKSGRFCRRGLRRIGVLPGGGRAVVDLDVYRAIRGIITVNDNQPMYR